MVNAESEYMVLLTAAEQNRMLPVSIGPFEAQSIALALSKQTVARPLTHDLFVSVLQELSCELQRIEIYALRENTFYARLLLSSATQDHEVDARPSDGIALALRLGAPVFVSEQILKEAGVAYETHEQPEQEPPAELTTLEILQKQLEQAIEGEHYEEAARLRDQIRKVTGQN
jgi:bifunctional DNase/RNase